MPRRLDVVVVNWNAGRQLYDCLASIAANDGRALVERVVVVDNASTDRSLDGLDALGLPLAVIRNGENRGFAAACNQGAAAGAADLVLFLNPDTRLGPASLLAPAAALDTPAHARTGIVGIQLVDEEGRVSHTCARFPSPGRVLAGTIALDRLAPRVFPSHFMTDWDHADSRAVDQVMGAYFLVRRSLFDQLGGFDERFFVYFEEVDFAYRARTAGWRSYFLADVRAYHKGGGTSEQVKAKRLFYMLRSRIQYAYKHFGRGPATLVAAATVAAEPVTRLLFAAGTGSREQVGATLEGSLLLWRDLPRILRRSTRWR